MADYLPVTPQERQEMLNIIGKSQEELFSCIPAPLRLARRLNLEQGHSEAAVRRELSALAKQNRVFGTLFRGAGAQKHDIPSVIGSLISRDEFLTAYTPYQAELSQGLLQAIFEYQSLLCRLTDMQGANASVYDGATAAAEAAIMCRERDRKTVLLSATLHPQIIEVVETYCAGTGMIVQIIPQKDGVTDEKALLDKLDASIACVVIASPNYFGQMEDVAPMFAAAHEKGAKAVMVFDPIASALLQSPGELGADIAVGEGQALGMPLSFGGPYLGMMACTASMLRRLPGRVVGQTMDAAGRRAFVLTLQAREQHIRREKASSSICSNQALCALTAAMYLSLVGPQGLSEIAQDCHDKASYLCQKLCEIKGVTREFSGEFFNEFVLRMPIPAEKVAQICAQEDMLCGLPLDGVLSGCMLWCATESNTKEEIDRLCARLAQEVCA